jgi:glutathione S-transferase
MIFYATALSSYSAKVRIVLCAKGLAFEERLPPGGYQSAEYHAIVPMGTLPAIRIGDWVLSESEAINEYLEESHPKPALMPPDPRARARVRFISRFHDLHLEPRVRSLFAHAKPTARNAAHVTAQRLEIERRLEQLTGWVRPQPYLLTPELSLADCGLLVTLPLARDVLAACGETLTVPSSLQGWLDTASQHPAVVQALSPWRLATQHWLQA